LIPNAKGNYFVNTSVGSIEKAGGSQKNCTFARASPAIIKIIGMMTSKRSVFICQIEVSHLLIDIATK